MAVTMPTLIQLLQDLCDELKRCLERESRPSRKDPIVLGDFIVDAYNRYLARAKELSDEPMVHALPEVVPLGPVAPDPERDVLRGDPRLGKMAEVALAARSLQTALQGVVKKAEPSEPPEVSAVLALLQSIEVALALNTGSPESLNVLVDQYNRCLGIAQEAVRDRVLESVFAPLQHTAGGEEETEARFTELRTAQKALFTYLVRLRQSGRLAQAPGDRSQATEPTAD